MSASSKPPNKSFDTDAQVRPCALRTRVVCASQVRRSASRDKISFARSGASPSAVRGSCPGI